MDYSYQTTSSVMPAVPDGPLGTSPLLLLKLQGVLETDTSGCLITIKAEAIGGAQVSRWTPFSPPRWETLFTAILAFEFLLFLPNPPDYRPSEEPLTEECVLFICLWCTIVVTIPFLITEGVIRCTDRKWNQNVAAGVGTVQLRGLAPPHNALRGVIQKS